MKAMYETFRRTLPRTWWFSTLTACLGAFAGLLGSLYAEEIKNAVPIIIIHKGFVNGPIVWPAVWFWTSFVAFGWFFGLGFDAQNEATNKLEGMIRTLPPRNFLSAFEVLFRQSLRVDWQAHEDKPDAETLKGSIITAISGVVHLVKAFDVRGDHARYSVNVMIFRYVGEIDPEQLNQFIRFAEPGYNTDAWDGVLQLDRDFAYTVIEGKVEPDATVPTILLPIPKPELRFDRGKATVLPGAPTVFCDPAKFVAFDKTSELSTWVREQSGLRPSIAEDMDQYFGSGGEASQVRSFFSIPIVLPPRVDEDASEVIGVLNIHSDREGIMPTEKGDLFVPLTTPFMLLIARSLAEYRHLPKKTQDA